MKAKKTTGERLDDLTLSSLTTTAQLLAMRKTIAELCLKTGICELRPGVSVEKFYQINFDLFLDSLLRDLEDESPGLAADYHEKIEKIRKAQRGLE